MPAIDEIQNDVACPACQYNLRGLQGDIIDCPECGLRIDVAGLISARWHGPWQLAPGYHDVQFPAVMSAVALVPFFVISAAFPSEAGVWQLAPILFLAVPLCISLVSITCVCRRFGVLEGLKLVTYAHLLLGGYIVGLLGSIVTFGWFLAERNPAMAFFTVLAIAAYLGCRRIDKILAEGCIRQHLRERSKAP